MPYKKPRFIRQESWRYKRLESGWRKPKGIDSKMRVRRKGRPLMPSVGYRSPRALRGLHSSGLREILVHRLEDLEGIDPKTSAVRIAHGVGTRKRLAIRNKVEKLKLTVLNPPKPKKGKAEGSLSEEKVSEK